MSQFSPFLGPSCRYPPPTPRSGCAWLLVGPHAGHALGYKPSPSALLKCAYHWANTLVETSLPPGSLPWEHMHMSTHIGLLVNYISIVPYASVSLICPSDPYTTSSSRPRHGLCVPVYWPVQDQAHSKCSMHTKVVLADLETLNYDFQWFFKVHFAVCNWN